MKILVTICIAISLVITSGTHAREYSFGIVPQQSAQKLARLWGPILAKLSEDSDITLKFSTAKNIPTFEERLAIGYYDFAYMNPYHFTVFNESPGYLAIAHQENKSIQGIIVVHRDSELEMLEELQGSTLAFPSPAAFAASILPQAQLNKLNIDYTPRYVSSHDSVYIAISRGLIPAGGGVLRTFNNAKPEVRQNLRVFWKTRQYTPHAFAAHPDVPEEDRLAIQKALIELKNTEAGLKLLENIGFSGIQSASDEDWNDVRALNMKILSEQR